MKKNKKTGLVGLELYEGKYAVFVKRKCDGKYTYFSKYLNPSNCTFCDCASNFLYAVIFSSFSCAIMKINEAILFETMEEAQECVSLILDIYEKNNKNNPEFYGIVATWDTKNK